MGSSAPPAAPGGKAPRLTRLPRNAWAVSLTSFFMDISSEMVINVVPIFLSEVVGVRTALIGLIEGVGEAISSVLKGCSGVLSDRLGQRKWLAVAGYGISALAKPIFYFAATWGVVAGARWTDRMGKGIRTAPRDALLADSVGPADRGLAFGLHRTADTLGAVIGLLVAIAVVSAAMDGGKAMDRGTFQTLALFSVVPAVLAVLTLALVAKSVRAARAQPGAAVGWRGLGRRFAVFLLIVGIFDLGNSPEAFLVLRARERGLGIVDILWVICGFNLVYALVAAPAGSLSDRVGRKRMLVAGWLVYAAIYLGFALAESARHIVVLYLVYGAYAGLTAGTAKAMVADLVPAHLRGRAFGTFHATLGLLDVPAAVIGGVLWQGLGSWEGFGPWAPFVFGSALALLAAVLLVVLVPETRGADSPAN